MMEEERDMQKPKNKVYIPGEKADLVFILIILTRWNHKIQYNLVNIITLRTMIINNNQENWEKKMHWHKV